MNTGQRTLLLWRHYLRVLEHFDPARSVERTRLAVASCGNAALAAAVIARAAGAPLDVFVPPFVQPAIAAALEELGANVTHCPRVPGERGDPCHGRFREALAAGALPFGCQGSDNGLTIDGGKTLGYEIVSQLSEARAPLDAIFVQVGGGAMASAVAQAFATARQFGALAKLPRLYAVQTEAASPLARAYDRVAERVGDQPLTQVLGYAAANRSQFMWPWETEPRSVAHGILDDETYDWLAVVTAMLESGGHPIVVDEATLRRATELAHTHTPIPANATGAAGLAGLLAEPDLGREQNIALLFTGGEKVS